MAYMGSNPKLKSLVSTGDTIANLILETRVKGRFVYATDLDLFFADDGANLSPLNRSSLDGIILGSAADVTNLLADYSTLLGGGGYLAASADGDKLTILDSYVPEAAAAIAKQIDIYGESCRDSILGPISFATGSDNSTISNLKFSDDITLDLNVKNINLSANLRIAITKTIVDNSTNADNLWLLIQEA